MQAYTYIICTCMFTMSCTCIVVHVFLSCATCSYLHCFIIIHVCLILKSSQTSTPSTSHHSHTLPSPLPPLTHPPPSLQGVLCRTLQGHGHWVNTMALSTDYALRTGAFDPSDRKLEHCGVEGMSCEYHVTSHVTILHLLFIHVYSFLSGRA